MANEEDFILRGEELINQPNISVGEFLLEICQYHDDKVALIDVITKKQLTYKELSDYAIKLAIVLRRKGYKEGDVIGLCGNNTIYYPIVILAATYIGAVLAPFNNGYSIGEVQHVVTLTKPKIIFSSHSTKNTVNAVAQKCDFVKEVVLIEPAEKNGQETIQSLTKDIREGDVENFEPAIIRDIKERDVLIMCSSGTTGLPKGVLLTHYNVLATFELYADELQMHVDEGDEYVLGVLPPFHVFGLMTLLLHFKVGVTTVILEQFQPQLYLQAIQDYKIRIIGVVPPILSFLAKHPLAEQYDLSSIKLILSGAAPVGKELEEAALKKYPNVDAIRQGYGMTETTLGVLKLSPDEVRSGSVGKIRPATEAKVIDVETKKILGPNQKGELCFRGATIMKGYLGNPKATAETIDPEGWLHTGDIGYYDEEGYFYIVDRLKELIKYKGYQVPPAELEALLLSHPCVLDAAVIGIPDEDAGELPKAFIVKKSPVTEKEIIDFVAKNVSNPKRLRGGVEFIDAIPKNPSGKILRRILREKAKVTSKL